MIKKYSIGFLIDADNNVVLIRKNKPEWQAGFLNGVGGHIEEGETPYEAMVREFQEEAGVTFEKWEQFAKLEEEEKYELYCFKAFVKDVNDMGIKNLTSEVIEIHPLKFLRGQKILPSAMWLIQLALDIIQ